MNPEAARKAFGKGIYLHAAGGPLTHNAGCLAEGLMELGIPVKLNTDKITARPVSMPLAGVDLASLVSPAYTNLAGYVVDITHTNAYVPFEGVPPARVIYLNQSDAAAFSRLPDDQVLLVAHENSFADKGGVRRPIAFGLSKRLIAATEKRPAFFARQHGALRNFRPTLNQGVRALLDIAFVPHLARHMPVDSSLRKADAYLAALLSNSVCLAYGGDFYSPIADNPWFAKHEPATAEAHAFKHLSAPAMVLRWDSFRLWESFAAGCLTVHLDFAKYGFALPVMPEPWVHYAPLDLDNLVGSVEELLDREKQWPDIAEAGRAWAIQHYAPTPTALRALAVLTVRS